MLGNPGGSFLLQGVLFPGLRGVAECSGHFGNDEDEVLGCSLEGVAFEHALDEFEAFELVECSSNLALFDSGELGQGFDARLSPGPIVRPLRVLCSAEDLEKYFS